MKNTLKSYQDALIRQLDKWNLQIIKLKVKADQAEMASKMASKIACNKIVGAFKQKEYMVRKKLNEQENTGDKK